MSGARTFLTAVAALVSAVGASDAHADLFNEVRVGVLDHDTDLVGSSKEGGFDLGVEVLSPPIDGLRLIGSPHVVLGAQVNSDGYTNMIYAGLLAQRDFAEGTFRPDDAFFLEGTVAIAAHDGKTDVRNTPEDAEWKSHGSHLLFRTGFGLGYRFDDTWSLTATFSHISNANFDQPNQGSNDIGLRLGMRF
jgi:lipid A 3-O-deacylase